MFRYRVKFYDQPDLITFSQENSYITDIKWRKKYIQLLGFIKSPHSTIFYSIFDLNNYGELPKIKGLRPVLIQSNGTIKIMTTVVKDVIREAI